MAADGRGFWPLVQKLGIRPRSEMSKSQKGTTEPKRLIRKHYPAPGCD
jgi:hypothetical protein